jgi:serine/threonine-protein kinase
MGDVWLGRDRRLRRLVAVKVMQQRWAGNDNVARRFREEAQLTSQLQHPGIPPVYETGALSDGRPFFCMKVVRGRTLAALLAKRRGPGDDLPRLLAAFEQVCQAVAYAHSKAVIHRDLKPHNVMVGAFGEVQVMDWGLAKVLHDETSRGRQRTETGPRANEAVTDPADRPDNRTQAGAVLGTLSPTCRRSRRAARSKTWISAATSSAWGRSCARSLRGDHPMRVAARRYGFTPSWAPPGRPWRGWRPVRRTRS